MVFSPGDVRYIAAKHQYNEKELAEKERKYLLTFTSTLRNDGAPEPVKIQVFFTTGTVATHLKHPSRGWNQLYRMEITTIDELEEIFINPRKHTDKGYRTKEEKSRRSEAAEQSSEVNMESLANDFIDHLIENNYVGPNVPNAVGITDRNLINIYNLIFVPANSRRLHQEQGAGASNIYVRAEDLLEFMTNNNLVVMDGDQVASFPRHNITCPLSTASGASLTPALTEEVKKIKLGPRSPVCVVSAPQPGSEKDVKKLITVVTKSQSNFILLHNQINGSSKFLTIPGYRGYRFGTNQMMVHNKLDVERLFCSQQNILWLKMTEPGIILDADGVKRDRVTLMAVGARLRDDEVINLPVQFADMESKCGGYDNPFLDRMIMVVDNDRDEARDGFFDQFPLHLTISRSANMVLAMSTGVGCNMEEKDKIVTIKVDKRFCSVCDVGFMTSAELEQFKRTPKYMKAVLFKHYQNCKSELLKSPHALGLEMEVVEADPGIEYAAGVVTITAKPNEVKTFKIKLRNGRNPEGDENRDPKDPKGIILDKFGLGKEEPVFNLQDDKGLVSGTKLRLKYDKKMKVVVRACSDQIGHYRDPLIVGFYHEIHSDLRRDADGDMAHVLSHMGLELLLKVETREMDELKPTKKFKETKKIKKWRARETVKGRRLETEDSLNKLVEVIKLDYYDISKARSKLIFTNFQEFDGSNPAEKQEYDHCVKLFDTKLNKTNYKEKWQLLLHCEEKQLEIDIRHYDMESVPIIRIPGSNNLYSLEVPGLEENRPSVMKGDKIYVKTASDPKDREFEGFVHQIQEQKVLLGFGPGFQHLYVKNMKFDVRFTVGRFPLRNMHRAVSLAPNTLMSTLFPTSDLLPSPSSLPSINCYNRLIEGNEKQLSAVQNILAKSSGECPYIVFGPPGTGKTVTLVEAVKQVAKLTSGCHILATAPSNTAADLLTERLLQHVVKRDILRVNAASRLVSGIPAKVREVSNLERDRIYYPGVEELTRYKIIVTTLVTAGRLVSAMFPPDHFTHVFIDESGQATEPETVIAMAGLLGSGAQLVMAGDPRQLGPVIRSSIAVRQGLNISLLERLMGLDMYNMDGSGQYDQRCITKLIKNFRSHKELLTVPKQLFYNNELEACADKVLTESCLNFEGLPPEAKRNKVPMIFHGVIGQDLKEETSPSFFNIEEIVIVRDYIKKLLDMKENKIQAKDIGVITPYRRQVQKIRQKLRTDNISDIMVGSTEEFQGQERRVIIVSTVRSNPQYVYTDNQYKLGFLKNPKRFNVAITRAKALLIVVGNPHILSQDHDWCQLLDWSVGRGCYTGARYSKETDQEVDRLAARFKDLLDLGDVSRMTQLEEPAWRTEN